MKQHIGRLPEYRRQCTTERGEEEGAVKGTAVSAVCLSRTGGRGPCRGPYAAASAGRLCGLRKDSGGKSCPGSILWRILPCTEKYGSPGGRGSYLKLRRKISHCEPEEGEAVCQLRRPITVKRRKGEPGRVSMDRAAAEIRAALAEHVQGAIRATGQGLPSEPAPGSSTPQHRQSAVAGTPADHH